MYVSPSKLNALLIKAGFDVSQERQKARFFKESGINKETAHKWFRKPIYNPTYLILRQFRDFLNSKLPKKEHITFEDFLQETKPEVEEFDVFKTRRKS